MNVERSKDYSVTTAEAWSVIGGFGAIADWHPVISSAVLSADGKQRTLTLADGAVLLEEIEQHDDAGRSYSYKILEAPLPISEYRGTIAVKEREGGCTVIWTSTFQTDLPEADADGAIGGIYEAGLDALSEHFG